MYVQIITKDTELALTILVIKIISLKIKIIQNESTQYKTEVSFGIEIQQNSMYSNLNCCSHIPIITRNQLFIDQKRKK